MPHMYVNGADIFYEIEGSGPDLVLLHGWGADNTVYDEQMEDFTRYFRVVRYDHRGHGKSSRVPGGTTYTIEQYTRDLKTLLESLGMGRVFLLGHSMGGAVALNFAIAFPESVNRLVLASTFAERKISLQERLQLILARLLPVSVITRPFTRGGLNNPTEEYMKRVTDYYINAGKETLMKSAMNIGNINYRDNLERVKAKTLILHGDCDASVPIENSRILNEGIADSRFHVIEGGNHAVNWENREEFNRTVLDFLLE